MTGDGLSIPVTHKASPLFDLVYVLSDRNERGITTLNGMQDNYEIICNILLLKNRRRKETQVQSSDVSYNNSSFKNSLMTESGRQGFVSAGLSKVKRPNHSIALTVLYHFFKQIKERLEIADLQGSKEKLSFFGLDSAAMDTRMLDLVPSEDSLIDMSGLLTNNIRYDQLRRMSLREAEEALFGDGCTIFFRKHFTSSAEVNLGYVKASDELRATVNRNMKDQPLYSFFQVAKWTDEKNETDSVMTAVRARMRDLVREIDIAQDELGRIREQRVDDLKFQRLPFMDKQNVRSFIRAFLMRCTGWNGSFYDLRLSLRCTENLLLSWSVFMRNTEFA